MSDLNLLILKYYSFIIYCIEANKKHDAINVKPERTPIINEADLSIWCRFSPLIFIKNAENKKTDEDNKEKQRIKMVKKYAEIITPSYF